MNIQENIKQFELDNEFRKFQLLKLKRQVKKLEQEIKIEQDTIDLLKL